MALKRSICGKTVQFEGPIWAKMPDNLKDLIAKMLAEDPQDRITATECLEHPYIASITLDKSAS